MENHSQEILDGLLRPQKRTPAKLFYDAVGIELFDRICDTDEYYPFRSEIELLKRHAGEIARHFGADCGLIELGSGASIKSRLLLDALLAPAWYAPVDVSKEALEATRVAFARDYPALRVHPVCCDFTRIRDLSSALPESCRARGIFFPGSTIGNLEVDEAFGFLRSLASILGKGGMLVVGLDLIKNRARIEAAYNDRAGVTAAFNLNVLTRLNREYGADFDLRSFRHRAIFNPALNRIEMHLVSLKDQCVGICGKRIHFTEGETIHTENSHKYDPDTFGRMASDAGFAPRTAWIDEESRFGVFALEAIATAMQEPPVAAA